MSLLHTREKTNWRAIVCIYGAFFLLALVWPSFSMLQGISRSKLWTYPDITKREELPGGNDGRSSPEKLESAFALGFSDQGATDWVRLRFGLPSRPVTLDVRRDGSGLQGRIEWKFLSLNLLITWLVIHQTGTRFLISKAYTAWQRRGKFKEIRYRNQPLL